MSAVFLAALLGFLRDRPGMAMTLALPPLVYLLFAAIFGAGASGDLETRVALLDQVRTAQSRELIRTLETRPTLHITATQTPEDLEASVISGRTDAGLVIGAGLELVVTPGREVAASALAAEVAGFAQAGRGGEDASPPLPRRTVGPTGDVQSLYYASAVSVMFVFFAAMHGAMAGLDDRRSGLQARLVLLTGGLWRVLAGRFAWLIGVGVAQTALVFAVALPRLPPLAPWQAAAGLVTTGLAACAAAGAGVALMAACRSREQAQPLSTVLVLVLAALGGSMAPRFLMPDVFRQIGWATPHAWVIEAGQAVLWRGQFDAGVACAWSALAVCGLGGLALAIALEQRRLSG